METGERAESSRHFYRYNGLLIVCHPDFPPHVWDGEKMTPIEMQGDAKPVYVHYDPFTGRSSIVNGPEE